ncbi:MAG TPA: HAD family hydrolase [Chloroflexota bacterium]|jgi:putative hydrolase of the HAD superfamily|nr:HAD family hydrolase [Chloroflexota bacterium]
MTEAALEDRRDEAAAFGAVRAVLFDYGHTLIDFTVPEDALHDAYGVIRRRLVAEARMDLPDAPELVERVARTVTRRVDESYATDRLVELDILELFHAALGDLGFVPHADTVRWVVEAEHTALTKHLICPPETIETLRVIHDSGVKIGIISNAHLLPYMMRRDWQNLGITPFVDASLVSSETGVRKPHPSLFERLLLMLDVQPHQAIFVGDRVFDDVGGAHTAGMRAILTREFRQEEVDATTDQPDFIVDRLEDILPYVLESAGREPVPNR